MSAVTSPPPDDAVLVRAARDGDPQAFSTLFERWFDRSYDVAFRIVRNRETAADVAQDTFLAAWKNLATLRDPAAFGGWVLRTSRNKALNRLAREQRSVAVGDEEVIDLADVDRRGPDAADVVTRDEQHDLVWAAAAALGERDASVLDLHLRHGLDSGEIGEALGITANNAHQVLFRLRARLGDAIQAWILWHHGEPRCEELATVLADRGIQQFGADAVRVIKRHAEDCAVCETRRAAVLAPEAMFAAVPVLVVPAGVREQVAHGLSSAGVPIGVGDTGAPAPPTDAGGPPVVPAGRDAGSARRRARRIAAALTAVVLVTALAAVFTSGDDESVTSTAASAPSTTAPVTVPTTGSPTTAGDDPGKEMPVVPLEARPSSTTTPSVPVVPGPDDLPVAPVPPSDTTTSTTSTTVAPSPPPPGPTTTAPTPPSVTAFTATQTGVGPCGATSGRLYLLEWSTARADEVTLTGPNVASGPHPATGTTTACALFGPAPTWTLTATGPGGTATEDTSG
jgi:RNA polymerase sigma factor (sigma-70 family)